MKQPRPVLILWHPEGDGDPEPVAIVTAAIAQRKLGDYNADRPDLGTHSLTELSARPLTWDDYHRQIDDYVTGPLCAFLSDELGTPCDTEHTGGGCDAIVLKGFAIADRVVDVLITEMEDAHAPLLGWSRGITVGFYDAATGDQLGETHNHGTDGYELTEPPMTAQQIADAIADTLGTVSTFGF